VLRNGVTVNVKSSLHDVTIGIKVLNDSSLSTAQHMADLLAGVNESTLNYGIEDHSI
jgi:hypothetical protein